MASFVFSTEGASFFGGVIMNSDNSEVLQAARINFYQKPAVHVPVILVEHNENAEALYADDNFEHEYCMNTTTWD